MGLVDADVTPRPQTNQAGITQNHETGTDKGLAARERKTGFVFGKSCGVLKIGW
jgi:hypothetical protein